MHPSLTACVHMSCVSSAVGARYCDWQLRVGGFNGEFVDSGAVLVVKTHLFKQPAWTSLSKPISIEVGIHCFFSHTDNCTII